MIESTDSQPLDRVTLLLSFCTVVDRAVIVDHKQCGRNFNGLAKKHTNFSLLLHTKI